MHADTSAYFYRRGTRRPGLPSTVHPDDEPVRTPRGPSALDREAAPFLAGLSGYDPVRVIVYDWWAR